MTLLSKILKIEANVSNLEHKASILRKEYLERNAKYRVGQDVLFTIPHSNKKPVRGRITYSYFQTSPFGMYYHLSRVNKDGRQSARGIYTRIEEGCISGKYQQ